MMRGENILKSGRRKIRGAARIRSTDILGKIGVGEITHQTNQKDIVEEVTRTTAEIDDTGTELAILTVGTGMIVIATVDGDGLIQGKNATRVLCRREHKAQMNHGRTIIGTHHQ